MLSHSSSRCCWHTYLCHCVCLCVWPDWWFDLPSFERASLPALQCSCHLSLGHWLPLHFRHIDVSFSFKLQKTSMYSLFLTGCRFDFEEDIAQAVVTYWPVSLVGFH